MQIYILSLKHQNLTYKLTFDWVSMCNYSDSSLSSRYRFCFQIQPKHFLQLQVIKAQGLRPVGP